MNADIISMLNNLSNSLAPVQSVIAGAGYLLGILFMLTAIRKLKKIGDSRARSHSTEKMFVPLAYIVGGSALIFLPSAITVLSNTAFGISNVLQYHQVKPYDAYGSVRIVIKTVGLIWFVRGCVLLVHASEPGIQHGPKGLAFLCAGVLAMNFEGSVEILNYIMEQLEDLTRAAFTRT